jgi:hypothetical protein
MICFVRFMIIFDGRSTRFETLIPLVTLRTAQTVLPISLLQHLKSLRKGFFFPQFETEFHANTLLFIQDPSFLNFQKIAEGTKHTFTQARVTR